MPTQGDAYIPREQVAHALVGGSSGAMDLLHQPRPELSGLCVHPFCVLSPRDDRRALLRLGEQVRSNIREDREGMPLSLEFTVSNASTCAVLQDAMVDLWHCDAVEDYSAFNSDNQTFLRGVQVSGQVSRTLCA